MNISKLTKAEKKVIIEYLSQYKTKLDDIVVNNPDFAKESASGWMKKRKAAGNKSKPDFDPEAETIKTLTILSIWLDSQIGVLSN